MTIEASIADAQQQLVKSAESNPSSITDFLAKLDPGTQRALRNTAIGGLLGGAAGMGAGVMSPEKSVLGSGIMGGLLGGVAGGAGTLGYDMLRSQIRMPGEARSSGSLTDQYVVDPLVGGMMNRPATAAGGVLGGAWAGYRLPTWGKALQSAADMDKVISKGSGGPGAAVSRQELIAARGLPSLKFRLLKMLKRLRTKGTGGAWAARPTAKNTALLAMHKVLGERGLYGKTIKHPVNLLALPAGLGVGYMVDRYLRGQNK